VLIAKTDFINTTLSDNGVSGKYLINTETAVICGQTGTESPCQTATFSDTKSYYVAQTYAAALAKELQANLWYSLQGWRASGLVDSNWNPLPAYSAFRVASTQLVVDTYLGSASNANILGYKFQGPYGQVWVVWNRDTADNLSLPGTPPNLR
jgi:hypothetical protein